MTKTVEAATSVDEAAVIATLTLAFATDPMTRWRWLDRATYLDERQFAQSGADVAQATAGGMT